MIFILSFSLVIVNLIHALVFNYQSGDQFSCYVLSDADLTVITQSEPPEKTTSHLAYNVTYTVLSAQQDF